MVVLAEIADKMPSTLSTLAISSIATAIAVGLARFRWWLALVSLPFFGLWNWISYVELHEPGFGSQIVREMGYGYVVGQFVCINLPPVVGAWAVTRFRVSMIQQARRSNGRCPYCGYPPEAGRCPECGADAD